MKLTVKDLARLMAEELNRDHWGDVDPYLFEHIAEGRLEEEEEDANDEDAEALKQVLERVISRLERMS